MKWAGKHFVFLIPLLIVAGGFLVGAQDFQVLRLPEGHKPAEASSPTGSRDNFGYVLDDSESFSWIDASDGNEVTFGVNPYVEVPLPFSFKFYEKTFNSVYITAFGYLSFNRWDYWPYQVVIPSPAQPNNIVAPYAAYLSSSRGKVYYKSCEKASSQCFVVEWYQVGMYPGESLTFEVILYENGDIVFQYAGMTFPTESYTCGSAGIEDSHGWDGLSFLPFCSKAPSNKAVRFRRPEPSARINVWPRHQGRFASPGSRKSFSIAVRNTGELGPDTFDFTFAGDWEINLYGPDGVSPLSDSDGDGLLDTGPLASGDTLTVTVEVYAPETAKAGDYDSIPITVTSSLAQDQASVAFIQVAIPVPFIQAFRDKVNEMLNLYLINPLAQKVKMVSGLGRDPAVVEAPGGDIIYVQSTESTYSPYSSIACHVFSHCGSKMFSSVSYPESSEEVITQDSTPAVAVTPDGRIGVIWQRRLFNRSHLTYNYNIYFAIIDPSGRRIYGPVNVTGNTLWGLYSNPLPRFLSPRIVATGDNRLFLVWVKVNPEGEEVYYAIYSSTGALIRPATKLVEGANSPALATVNSKEVFLAYSLNGVIHYIVLDSSGGVVKAQTSLGSPGRNPDAVQLSTGEIFLAWSGPVGGKSAIRYVLLLDYENLLGPFTLSNPASPSGDDYVSVSADLEGHAILTWTDYDRNYRYNLYYALVDNEGAEVTPPMIFLSLSSANKNPPLIESNYEGYGNASFPWPIIEGVNISLCAPEQVVAWSAFSPSYPKHVEVQASCGNQGLITATNTVLTATINTSLTIYYVSPEPSAINDHELVWNLGNLGYLDSNQVLLLVKPTFAESGSRYPITWTLTSAEPDAAPGDSTAVTYVTIPWRVFMPLVLRNR